MVLSDAQIQEAVRTGEISIDGFDEANLQPASYDMTVGPEGFTTSTKKKVNIQEAGFLILKAGDYGLVTTHEAVKLPANFVGRFGLRSYYLRKGLFASVGPQIDPGYRGRLILGLMNLSPTDDIVLGYKEPLCTVEFTRLSQAATKPNSGPYQDRLTLTSDDIEPLIGSEGMAFSEILTTLRGLSRTVSELSNTVSQLTRDMSTLKWWTLGVIGAGLAIVAIVVGLKG